MNLIDLYFNPSGRINRPTFWLEGVLLLRLIWFVINVLVVLLVVLVEGLGIGLSLTQYFKILSDLVPALHTFAVGSVGIHYLTGLMKALVVDSAGVFVIGCASKFWGGRGWE